MNRTLLLLAIGLSPFAIAQQSCETGDQDGDGWTEDGGDCDDLDFEVNPDAEEVCDGIDNNCDGVVDEGNTCEFEGLEWTGGCYNSDVGASGLVTLMKEEMDGVYTATLRGEFTINSPTYGYVRHELPPGFLPLDQGADAYTCEEQYLDGYGDTSEIVHYGGHGVHVRFDTQPGFEQGSLWFPEKFYNGTYTLTCTWETTEENPSDNWSSCASISLL